MVIWAVTPGPGVCSSPQIREQYWFNVSPKFVTLAQHHINIGPTSCVLQRYSNILTLQVPRRLMNFRDNSQHAVNGENNLIVKNAGVKNTKVFFCRKLSRVSPSADVHVELYPPD